MSKLAVIFPGMGYHADKPLLYYAAKLAESSGYQIVKITYPPRESLNSEQMRPFAEDCVRCAKDTLAGIDLSAQDDILFISKSIGTVVATAFAASHEVQARHILFTPLLETFIHATDSCGIAFSGTKDQYADHERIKALCEQHNIPLTAVPGGNHSLETGDVLHDLQTMQNVMQAVKAYI